MTRRHTIMLSLSTTVLFLTALPLASTASSDATAQKPQADGSNVRVKRTDDVSISSLKTLVEQQQALLEQQASVIQSVQAELAASRSRISDLEDSVTSLQAASTAVAFSAQISANQDTVDDGVSLGHHQTVVFNQAITNIGNAYNTNSGIFTAPVAGSYAFFLSQMTPNQHGNLFLAITKNGASVLDYVFTEGGSGENFDQGSSLVTTHLAVGDQVRVRQESGDAVRGDHWTIFSGFLLQAE